MVAEYRKVMKGDERIVAWEPESEEEERQNRLQTEFNIQHLLTQLELSTKGKWQAIRQKATNGATATSCCD